MVVKWSGNLWRAWTITTLECSSHSHVNDRRATQKYDKNWPLTCYSTGSGISLIFLVATTIYYISNKNVRTNSGLSFLFFIIPLTVACACLAILQLSLSLNGFLKPVVYTFAGSLVLTYLWMNVMIFDAMWTFYRFRNSTENLKRFKFYCAFVVVILLVFAFF